MEFIDSELIWLWISSFGVVFAFLSFMNEIKVFKNIPTYKKGVSSILLGTILFFILPYQIYRMTRDRNREIDEKVLI